MNDTGKPVPLVEPVQEQSLIPERAQIFKILLKYTCKQEVDDT